MSDPTHETLRKRPKDPSTTSAPITTDRLQLEPRLRRIGQGWVGLGLAVFFLILAFVAFKWPRTGNPLARPDSEKAAAQTAAQPLDAELLENLADRERRRREIEALPAAEPRPLPPAPSPGPPRPQAPAHNVYQAVFDSPLTGSRSRTLPLETGGGGSTQPSQSSLGPSLDRFLEDLRVPPAHEVLARAEGSGEGGALGREPPRRSLPVRTADLAPFTLRQGSYLPLVLIHGLDSDVAGTVQARLARDVYDSASFQHLLLPQGTLFLGQQRSVPQAIDDRLLVDWRRIVFPDGRSVQLLEPQAAAAVDGSLGMPGRISRHWGRRFGSALLLGVLGATFQLSQPQQSSDFGRGASPQQVSAAELGRRVDELAQQVLEQELRRPPTLHLEAGSRLSLLLLQDLVFDQPYRR